jgi:hypothetical protein
VRGPLRHNRSQAAQDVRLTGFNLLGLSPLSTRRASARRSEKVRGLFEPAERRVSFRATPTVATTRRTKRDTGVFFWFVFCHAEENEQSNSMHLA